MTFSFSHLKSLSHVPVPMHTHDGYEIYFFLQGDCDYIVEGNSYSLASGDLIIINDKEIHQMRQKTAVAYERMVLNIDRAFFSEMGCPEYEAVFRAKSTAKNSKVEGNLVSSSGIRDAFERLSRYAENQPETRLLMRCVIVEILYLLNSITIQSEGVRANKAVNRVVEYINANLTETLSLENIAEHFYISKFHLCRIFKSAIGLTINQYINKKRLMLVRDSWAKGKTINQACLDAGFASYSAFYRTYVKEFGYSPKQGLQN